MKKTKIGNRILGAVAIFVLVIIVLTSIFVCTRYYLLAIDDYTSEAYSFSRMAADYIDGDTIKKYYLNGEKDDYYYDVLDYLNVAQKESEILYYYVFVPRENDVVYIWDANTAGNACELGYSEAYMSERSKSHVESIMCEDPPEKLGVDNSAKYGSIGQAYTPIFDSTGEPVAVVGVDLSMPDLFNYMGRFIVAIILSVAAVAIVANSVFFALIDKNIIQPITKLTDSVKHTIGNLESDEAAEIDIHTGDEFEELASAYMDMDKDLREYIRELETVTAEKERIGAELNVATQIQADMLPRIFPAFPDRSEFDIYATMTPAKEVGGDFYDYFLVDNDHIALVMADVSGKGVPAALFMVIAKTLIKNSAQTGLSPAEVLQQVNEQLCEGNEANLFVTVWLAIIQISTGKGVAANAGHEHPALCRRDGSYELIVYKHSPAVAVIDGMVFREHEFELEPGDRIFVYTDGVTEATDVNNELFGNDRMLEALNSNRSTAPQELLPAMQTAIETFVGEAPQFDDITMLSFSYKG